MDKNIRKKNTNKSVVWNSLIQQLYRDWKPNVFVLIICLLWICIAPSWYEWMDGGEHVKWIPACYEFLNEQMFVNLPMLTILVWLIYRWGYRIWKDEDIRLFRLFLILFICLLLYRGKPTLATIIGEFDYKDLLTILLIFPLVAFVVNVIRYIRHLQKEKKHEIKNITNDNEKTEKKTEKFEGFTPDNEDISNSSKSLDKYADAIIHRLLHTDLTKEAYAIGITGQWGSGKTTFLRLLKEKLKDNAEIVDFNPWNCRTPEQVIEDLFAKLQNELSSKHSSLSRPIHDYAKLVNSVSLSLQKMSFTFQPFSKTQSISKKKEELSKRFSLLSKPVIVFIDDLDRSESDEMYEVLRLIRNTADLSNMIYVAAYDRSYVTNILESKKINNPSAYLEKIFPVEIHLPKVEDVQLWNTLCQDIGKQNCFKFDITKKFKDQFNQEDRELILDILNNYRSVKRFSRLFMLLLSYLYQKNAFPKEHKLLDLFWLELLHISDENIYNILADEPYKILKTDIDEKRYYFSTDAANSQDKHYKEEKTDINPTTSKILSFLFPSDTISPLSICHFENYDKYFTLSVSPFRLSLNEFNQLFSDKENPDRLVQSWITNNKYITSIVYQFQNTNIKQMKDDDLRIFLHGILSLCWYTSIDSQHKYEIRSLLFQEKYSQDQISVAHNIVKDWFTAKIITGNSPILVSTILKKLYGITFCDENFKHRVEPPILISNEEIENLLKETIKNYLEAHPELTAINILKENEELGKIFHNCSVMVKDESCGPYCEYKQVAFGTIIDHFSKQKEKPDILDYNNFTSKMFSQPVLSFDDPYEENEYEKQCIDKQELLIQSYFGNTDNNLVLFKQKCFTQLPSNDK